MPSQGPQGQCSEESHVGTIFGPMLPASFIPTQAKVGLSLGHSIQDLRHPCLGREACLSSGAHSTVSSAVETLTRSSCFSTHAQRGEVRKETNKLLVFSPGLPLITLFPSSRPAPPSPEVSPWKPESRAHRASRSGVHPREWQVRTPLPTAPCSCLCLPISQHPPLFDLHDSQAGLWEPCLWSQSPRRRLFQLPSHRGQHPNFQACLQSLPGRSGPSGPCAPPPPTSSSRSGPLPCSLLTCPALPREASGWSVSVQCPGDLVCSLLLPSLPSGVHVTTRPR